MNKIGFILLILFSTDRLFAQENEIIEITGEAEIELTPNQIFLEINIQEKDIKGRKSLEELENEMLEKLQKLNIAVNENLSVRDVSSNFKYHFIGSPDIRTSKSYQLELNEPKQIPDVIISLEELGISNINLDRLDHTEIDQFKKNARIQAIKDAKTKATYLLDAVDEELGKLIYIKELTTEDLGNTLQGRATGIIVRSATMHGSSSKQYQSIEFEKIKIEYKILAKFKIK